MPYSPIPKFPVIMQKLIQRGYSLEIPLAQLRQVIMLETGAMKDQTIGNIIKAMEELGYIRMNQAGFFLNCETEKKKMELSKNPEKEANNLLDSFSGVPEVI